MTGTEKVEIIRERLEKNFQPQQLQVVDESDHHIGHAGHQGGGMHFAIIINADKLNALTRVEAHRQIYELFSDMIPNEIHALRIVILAEKKNNPGK